MTLTIKQIGKIAVVTVDNPPVNALSQAVRQDLWNAAEALDRDPSVDAVVLICAGRTFIAGADVSEFGKPPLPLTFQTSSRVSRRRPSRGSQQSTAVRSAEASRLHSAAVFAWPRHRRASVCQKYGWGSSRVLAARCAFRVWPERRSPLTWSRLANLSRPCGLARKG